MNTKKFLLALAAIAALALSTTPVRAVSGAISTTVNEDYDGTGHCLNGNPNNNCNIYDAKQFVWLSGLPLSAGLDPGTYFFSVLVPGGQNQDPNDVPPVPDLNDGDKNLSDDYDSYQNR